MQHECDLSAMASRDRSALGQSADMSAMSRRWRLEAASDRARPMLTSHRRQSRRCGSIGRVRSNADWWSPTVTIVGQDCLRSSDRARLLSGGALPGSSWPVCWYLAVSQDRLEKWSSNRARSSKASFWRNQSDSSAPLPALTATGRREYRPLLSHRRSAIHGDRVLPSL